MKNLRFDMTSIYLPPLKFVKAQDRYYFPPFAVADILNPIWGAAFLVTNAAMSLVGYDLALTLTMEYLFI